MFLAVEGLFLEKRMIYNGIWHMGQVIGDHWLNMQPKRKGMIKSFFCTLNSIHCCLEVYSGRATLIQSQQFVKKLLKISNYLFERQGSILVLPVLGKRIIYSLQMESQVAYSLL